MDTVQSTELMSRKEAAAFLRLTPKFLATSAEKLGIPFSKVSRNKCLYRKSDLEKWLASRTAIRSQPV